MSQVIAASKSSGNILEVQNNQVTKLAVAYDGDVQFDGNVQVDGGKVQDSAGLGRVVLSSAKTIVDGSPTTLFTVPIAAGTSVGGMVSFHVFASDGTDHQAIQGILNYASVNKAGTLTNTITYVTANEAKAVSTGTITLSFTAAEDTADVLSIKVQPTGSLTETSYNITFTVLPAKGGVTLA